MVHISKFSSYFSPNTVVVHFVLNCLPLCLFIQDKNIFFSADQNGFVSLLTEDPVELKLLMRKCCSNLCNCAFVCMWVCGSNNREK